MHVDKATAVLSRIQSQTSDAFSLIEFRSLCGKLYPTRLHRSKSRGGCDYTGNRPPIRDVIGIANPLYQGPSHHEEAIELHAPHGACEVFHAPVRNLSTVIGDLLNIQMLSCSSANVDYILFPPTRTTPPWRTTAKIVPGYLGCSNPPPRRLRQNRMNSHRFCLRRSRKKGQLARPTN